MTGWKMKINQHRWRGITTFMLFILLCMSLTYWALQAFKPSQRVLVEAPLPAADVNLEAAAGLFGGRGVQARTASNYQLKGVVLASDPAQSVAILSENGKPSRAVRAGGEIAPNVRVKEVQRHYVLLSEAGSITRIDLPRKSVAAIIEAAPATAPSITPASIDQAAVAGAAQAAHKD